MKIIDTHCHIFAEQFENDIDKVIDNAKSVGVEKILMPNIDATTIKPLCKLSNDYKGYCLPMMGLHPTSVTQNWEQDLELIKDEFQEHKFIGIGEIGIDLYWSRDLKEQQQKAFERQLEWSIEYNLPVSIHSREACAEVIESIYKIGANNLRGVFHSFTGSKKELDEIKLLRSFMIGVNGVVTYKKTDLREILQDFPIDRIVIETDAPYLPPVPFRGKRNEPAYTSEIIKKLSEVFNKNVNEIATITTDNAKRLFQLN